MIRFVAAIFSLLLLISCSDHGDIMEYIEDVKKTSKKKVEPIEPTIAYQSLDYKSGDRRSPFMGLQAVRSDEESIIVDGEMVVQQPRPDAHRVREYLERFTLADFVMVGTLSKKGITWGLVQDNTGLVHAVKIGDYIGENAGKVISIGSDQIDILETVPNGEGGWMESNAYIDMQTQEN